MAERKTPSRPLAAELSPEILWYLEDRGYGVPEVVPRIRTPEPRGVKGAVFDALEVDAKIEALSYLRHTQGRWAGRPLVPSPAQVAYIIAPVFGWRIELATYIRGSDEIQEPTHKAAALRKAGWVELADSRRKARIIHDAYVEMPRKGGKTSLVAGLAMLLAFADGEHGAEVLLGAASRDQASRAFAPLAAVAKGSPILAQAGVRALRTGIFQESTQSFIKTVSSRGELAHGANVHGGLIDELHAHKNGGLLEAIESGSGAREQPLIFIITTADDGQTTSVYAQRRDLIEKIAKNVFKAPAMYGVVFAADDDDDPWDEKTWAKANPLYPITPNPASLRKEADKAKVNNAAKSSFLRLHLGIRSKLDAAYFNLDAWDANAGEDTSVYDSPALRGREAIGGLDLASVSDLTALTWLFPAPGGAYDVRTRFWVPEAAIARLDVATANSASSWVEAGWLALTPGDVTDYGYIKNHILADMERFDVRSIGFDRWNSTQLVIELMEAGAPMERVSQSVQSLSAPLKELDRLVRVGARGKPMLRHGGNPVLRWNADNLRPYIDANGNVKPDKKRSLDKIDGISALTNAMFVAMTMTRYESAYDSDNGLTVL